MKKSLAIFLSLIFVVSMCFATSVSAEDFVPSASKAEAPEIMAADDVKADELPGDIKAEDVVAVVKGGDKNAYVTADAIVQLSVSEAEKIIENGEAENADAAQALVDAFNAIAKLEGGVASDKNIAKAAEDLGIANPKMNVTDIFEVNLGEAGNEALKADGASVTLKFKNTSGAVQGKLIVAHMVGDVWKTVAKDKVQVTKDTIKVEFDSLCPVMFISVAEGQAAETDAPGTESKPADTTPTTPEEKDNNLDTIITVAIIVVVVAGVVVAIYLLYKNGKLDSVVKVNKQRIVHPDRSKYKKSKKAKKWSRKKQTRRQKRKTENKMNKTARK